MSDQSQDQARPSVDPSIAADAALSGLPESITPVDEAPVIQDAPEAAPVVETAEIVVQSEGDEDSNEVETVALEPNAIQDFPINMTAMAPQGSELLELPSQLDRHTAKALDDAPNVELMKSADGRRWAQVLSNGLIHNTMREVLVPTLAEPGSEFRQNNQVNGISVNGASPRFKDQAGQNLKGERALLRLVSHLGHGTIFQAPLWHSGIWVTFKPPTESEIIELNRQMMAEKIRFGRSSYGLMYSNMTAFTIDKLISFALEHVYDLSTKAEDINIGNLRDHIVSQDIQSLLWGFICTMYPRGFLYERGCTNDPAKCNFVLKETLNVTKLQWTNMKALTEWQKTHMSSRQPKTKTLADIVRYKQELTRVQKKRIVLNEGQPTEVAFTIRSPSITEYIDSGFEWINGIVENVDRAIGADPNINERNNTITLNGQATALRQYAHWIESIEYNENIVDDREAINNSLNVITADETIRDLFIDEIIKFINGSTVSVIGIPVFDCPKCKMSQEGSAKLPHHTNVIPLDVPQIFFALISQRLEKIAER